MKNNQLQKNNHLQDVKFYSKLRNLNTALYIFRVYFRKHWGYSLQFFSITFIFIGFFLSSLGARSVVDFQNSFNNTFLITCMVIIEVAVIGIVNRIFSDMKNNVMYKRLKLTGISRTSLINCYTIWSFIISFIAIFVFILVCMLSYYLMLARSASVVSTSNLLSIIFNKNFAVNLEYLFIFFLILSAAGIVLNSICFNSTILNMCYPLLLVISTILYFALSFLPSLITNGSSHLIYGWVANSYYFKYLSSSTNAYGISTFTIAGQIAYFVLILVVGLGFFGSMNYWGYKKFIWSK